ncbi:hypothetical protein BC567DRAFT_222849 [Phyllosticta citribraziliensis]
MSGTLRLSRSAGRQPCLENRHCPCFLLFFIFLISLLVLSSPTIAQHYRGFLPTAALHSLSVCPPIIPSIAWPWVGCHCCLSSLHACRTARCFRCIWIRMERV